MAKKCKNLRDTLQKRELRHSAPLLDVECLWSLKVPHRNPEPIFDQVHTLLATYHLPVESLDATWCKEFYKTTRTHLTEYSHT